MKFQIQNSSLLQSPKIFDDKNKTFHLCLPLKFTQEKEELFIYIDGYRMGQFHREIILYVPYLFSNEVNKKNYR
jgi:hypothetical protein